MGNKNIKCPKCLNNISNEEIKSQIGGDIDIYKEKKNKLQKLIKDLECKQKEDRAQEQKLQNKINEINKKEKELKILQEKLDKEKDYIENKLKKMESNWEKQFKVDIKNKDAAEYYDLIVCIDSISGIESGWKVKCSAKGKELYIKMKDKELVKVGVVGLRNKGKSWLLQKFLKKTLPKGTSIKTEGLSIKYPNEEDLNKNRNYILLDSAGTEEPLLDNDKILMKMNQDEAFSQIEYIAKDKTLTELFLQQFIIASSDILLVVVGVLTYSEQKLLNKIQKILKQKKGYKKLFIIHNLQNFIERKQIEDYLDEYLKHSATFTLKETTFTKTNNNSPDLNKNSKYFFETFHKDNKEDSAIQVFHLIMANEFSTAGEYYNDFTINFLNYQLNSFTNIKSFPVIEKIKDDFINFSKEAFEEPITESEINISSDLIIQLKPEKKIVFKKCFIDEMGFSNFFGSGFEPNYCVYKDNDKINVTFEASGKVSQISPECYAKDGNLIFSISGNKEVKMCSPDEKKIIYENTIKQGKFNFNIKLPISNEFKLENPEDPEFVKGNTENGSGGIYTFSYNLYNKKKIKKVFE